MAPTEKVKKPDQSGKKKNKHPLNTYLKGGIMRYSKAKMYKRRALYRLKDVKPPVVKKEKKPIKKIQKIGGPNNGGERVVYLKKSKAYYPTKKRVTKRPARGTFSRHPRYVRRSLKPGRVLILLAGRHQGKRVVLLKALQSGLLLVTGPFALNSCPLRRISQRYVIACQTRLDLGDYKIPEHINDKYFCRKGKDKKKEKSNEADIFATKKEKYVPNEQRKDDQKNVDTVVLNAIKKHPESKYLRKYLKSMFSLRSTHYPHRMKF